MKNPLTKTTCILVFACILLVPAALAVNPPPGGGYPNENTALGEDALFGLTTGIGNVAIGFHALFADTSGSGNTATGWYALADNTTGGANTATGTAALSNNTTGVANTATGHSALLNNTTGFANTAAGVNSLFYNITGNYNTAVGDQALYSNFSGIGNTALGVSALNALVNIRGASHNIALGDSAGSRCRRSDNIMIGNIGSKQDEGAIRIGTRGTHLMARIAGISGATVADGVGVVINPDGQLGTITSSARYKEAIKPMKSESDAILSLQPVTFRYKKELDPNAIPQFGLVAEQVAKVDPDLVARDEKGKPYTVRYEAVNAMLLNEFLKEHRKVEEQGKEIAALRSMLEKQAAQMQMVSDRLDALPPRLVENR